MKTGQVHINFETMASALREYARREAAKADSTIVYVENGQLIEEHPKSHTKKALKKAVAQGQ